MADVLKKPTLATKKHVVKPLTVPSKESITFSARELAGEALETVAELMRGTPTVVEHEGKVKIAVVPAGVRLAASKEILDRAVGQAPLKVDVTKDLSQEQVAELAKHLIQTEHQALLAEMAGQGQREDDEED